MLQENEIVMFLLGIGVFIFTLINQLKLKRLPEWKILISGFYFLIAGWTLTVLEGFFWKGTLNYLEHICYAVSSVLVAIWCWRAFGDKKKATL